VKVEYKYDARSGTQESPSLRRMVAVYYYTGEEVGPGRYQCTFCGNHTTVARIRVLPPCQACDSPEFALEAAA
jgi:ribosomal protein L37AE/L43A